MASRRCRCVALALAAAAVGQAFIVPGRLVHKGARRASVLMKANTPLASEEEVKAEAGLKVSPYAWKWPKAWPYNADYFSRKTESSVEADGKAFMDPIYDDKASAALADHYRKFIPQNAAVLELGAAAHSYMPEDLQLSRLVGVGINNEEMAANGRLTERLVQDLNDNQALPYDDGAFDAVVIANSVEFWIKPREVLREAWRCLKPGGIIIVSFATKNKYFEDRQIKLWGSMNDDQRIWIVGSFLFFAAGDGYADLKGYDYSEGDSKGMLAGFSGKTPCHVIQAYKAEMPPATEPAYKRMLAQLWTAPDMEMDDKALVLSRLNADYSRAKSEEEKERVMESVSRLPLIYRTVQPMGANLPIQLKALLGASLAPNFKGTDAEVEQLKRGLGLEPASEDFWKPLGGATIRMTAEDKVLLLAEFVPTFADEERAEARKEFIAVLPELIAKIAAKCPEMTEADQQLLAADLLVSDFLYESTEERAAFMPWFEGLNKADLEGYLEARKDYKEAKAQAAV